MMRALVSSSGSTAVVAQVPRPNPSSGEILVKVKAIAQNPTDWKAMASVTSGRIIGCDFCGTVEDPNGSQWSKGQRVAGFVQGTAANPMRGSFAEFVAIEHDLVYAVPDGITDLEAASVPLAFATAMQAIFQKLQLPEHQDSIQDRDTVLINGGSTSVGQYAIQLCRSAGLYVIATASEQNHALLRALGVDECIDYKSSDWPSQIRRSTQDKLVYALDCVSTGRTTELVSQAMSSETGKIVVLLPPEGNNIPQHIDVVMVVVYTVFNRRPDEAAFSMPIPPQPQDKAFWVKYLQKLPVMLETGKVRANKIKHIEGGLEALLSGFEMQKNGQVTAEKLCYTI